MQARSDGNLAGIDISHYDTGISYDAIAAQGKRVVYIKASEGSTGGAAHDPALGTHNDQCRERGLATGPYHFIHLYAVSTVQAQADNFLSAISGRTFDCPVALDCEDTGYHDGLGSDEVTAQTLEWADKIRAAAGVEVILYSNTAFIREHFTADIARLRMWIADYRSADAPGENGRTESWVGFQYSGSGKIGNLTVDLDEFTPDIVIPAWCYGGQPQPAPGPAPAPEPAPAIDPDILARQQALNRLHIPDGAGNALSADGILGPKSAQAYKRLQTIAGISADGIWGPDTQAALDAIRSEPLLRKDSRGAAVRYVQWRVGQTGVWIDGIYGVRTAAGVRSWQKAHGVAADGIVGPNTWSTMMS